MGRVREGAGGGGREGKVEEELELDICPVARKFPVTPLARLTALCACVTTAASCDESTCHVPGPPRLSAVMPAHDASSKSRDKPLPGSEAMTLNKHDAGLLLRYLRVLLDTGQRSKRTRSKICALWNGVSLRKD